MDIEFKLLIIVFFFFVLDNQAPVVECPANIKTYGFNNTATAVNWSLPIASDNSQLSVHVVCKPDTGSNFKAGLSIVNCTATDLAQNSASCDFEVNVISTY